VFWGTISVTYVILVVVDADVVEEALVGVGEHCKMEQPRQLVE
jgi:hypothetical protein